MILVSFSDGVFHIVQLSENLLRFRGPLVGCSKRANQVLVNSDVSAFPIFVFLLSGINVTGLWHAKYTPVRNVDTRYIVNKRWIQTNIDTGPLARGFDDGPVKSALYWSGCPAQIWKQQHWLFKNIKRVCHFQILLAERWRFCQTCRIQIALVHLPSMSKMLISTVRGPTKTFRSPFPQANLTKIERRIFEHGKFIYFIISGSSSGYDSPGDSSDDNIVLQSAHTAKRTTVDDVTVSKVMRYSSTDVLSNSLEIILSMPNMCDVMFLVGEDKVPVYGVKAILSSRSKTMYKIIMKAQQEQELASQRTGSPKRKSAKHTVVRVRKYQPEDFRKIIQFMHCGKVQISKRSITGTDSIFI